MLYLFSFCLQLFTYFSLFFDWYAIICWHWHQLEGMIFIYSPKLKYLVYCSIFLISLDSKVQEKSTSFCFCDWFWLVFICIFSVKYNVLFYQTFRSDHLIHFFLFAHSTYWVWFVFIYNVCQIISSWVALVMCCYYQLLYHRLQSSTFQSSISFYYISTFLILYEYHSCRVFFIFNSRAF